MRTFEFNRPENAASAVATAAQAKTAQQGADIQVSSRRHDPGRPDETGS